MDVPQALTRLGGISDRKSLVQATSHADLDRSLSDGSIIRVGRNIYALPVVDDARLAAARVHGAVSHLSAALAHGWKVKLPPVTPMVTVPRNRSPRYGQGMHLSYSDLLAVDVIDGVTSPLRTVVDCSRALPFDEALAVADSALRSGKVDADALLQAASVSPRTGRPAAVRVARAASHLAANPFESVLRAVALNVPGLSVVPQGAVSGVGHADLTDPHLQIAIEAESFEFHALAEAFRYDVRRYTAMTRAGWLVVRFVWEDVMYRQAYVRAVLSDLVAVRAHEHAFGPRGA